MPYYTKNMVRYMKKQASGKNPNDDDDDDPMVSMSELSEAPGANQSMVPPSTMSVIKSNEKVISFAGNSRGDCSRTAHSAINKGKITGFSAPKQRPNRPAMSGRRHLRVLPSCIEGIPTYGITNFPVIDLQKIRALSFDDKRLMYMKNLLRLQVDRINRIEGPTPTQSKNNNYPRYEVNLDSDQSIHYKSSKVTLYKAKHKEFAEMLMLCKVYTPEQTKALSNPIYLKTLRHLGKKHPYIVQTWDLFIDDRQRLMIFQEYANRGNMEEYLSKTGCPEEAIIVEWARGLYRAMDYLGDMGICHRDIRPRNVLITHKELNIRLTGFYNSIIYWNVAKEDILYFPCRPVAKKRRDQPDFQAPEVYGNPDTEEYDPITADIWSYGAVVFYSASIAFPYNFKADSPKIESDIQNNVHGMDLTPEGKDFLARLLTCNAVRRLTFDQIMNQQWFSKFKRDYSIMPKKG